MKKFVILLTTLFIIPFALQSEETVASHEEDVNQSYVYYSIGGGLPSLVTVDFGKRIQHHHHGFEAGIGVGYSLILGDGKFFANYLYFSNPNQDYQTYVGLGGKSGFLFLDGCGLSLFYLTPQFLFGKEYRRGRFIQATIGVSYFPLAGRHGIYLAPSLNVSWGTKF